MMLPSSLSVTSRCWDMIIEYCSLARLSHSTPLCGREAITQLSTAQDDRSTTALIVGLVLTNAQEAAERAGRERRDRRSSHRKRDMKNILAVLALLLFGAASGHSSRHYLRLAFATSHWM